MEFNFPWSRKRQGGKSNQHPEATTDAVSLVTPEEVTQPEAERAVPLDRAVEADIASVPEDSPSSEAKDTADSIFANESMDLLFDLAQGGFDEDIALGFLAAPIDKVSIHLASDGQLFDIYARVNYVSDKGNKQAKTLGTITKQLSAITQEQGKTVTERGGSHIVRGPLGTPLVIGQGRGYSLADTELHVTTGQVLEGYDQLISLAPSPKLEKETFTNALIDVVGTLDSIVNETYSRAGISYDRGQNRIAVGPPRSANGGEKRARDISSEFGAERPRVSFDDIGGQEAAKTELQNLG